MKLGCEKIKFNICAFQSLNFPLSTASTAESTPFGSFGVWCSTSVDVSLTEDSELKAK